MSSPEPSLHVHELNHVALHVRDLDASIHFYETVLELPRLARPDFGFPGAWFALGSQELHLIADAPLGAGPQPTHYALRVEDASASAARLQAKGFFPERGPAPRPDGAIQVFLRDPDGYVIELVSFPRPA